MKKNFVVNPEPNTHHFYYDTPFSPETFYIYNISAKHALDGTHNASRVSRFVSKLSTTFPFLPKNVPSRVEKILNSLHYGWCSHVMELLRGDLNYIRAERDKKVPNDHLIADVGNGIEKLLDTFEIAIRLDELSSKPLAYGASLRGSECVYQNEEYTLGERFCCHLTAIVHPESSVELAPKRNGQGGGVSSSQGGGGAGSIFHHIVPPTEDAAHWQLFFDMLVRSLSAAAFMVQENVETYNGYLKSSHLPDMFRVLHYLTNGEGQVLYAALRKKSILYKQGSYTCRRDEPELVDSCQSDSPHGEQQSPAAARTVIEIDLSAFEKRPLSTSDDDYLASMAACCDDWYPLLKELTAAEGPLTRSTVVQFIDILVEAPLPFQYVMLHYLVADGLAFSIDQVHRSDYLEWVIEVFISVRFFCGLATVTQDELQEMMSGSGGSSFSGDSTAGENSAADQSANNDSVASDDDQIPESIASNIRARGMTPAGVPWVDPASAKQLAGDSSVDSDKAREMGMVMHWGEFGAARERMRKTLKTDRQAGIWSAFQWQFRYHHLSSAVMRWRWCSHVKRPGRMNTSRYTQIDRELTYLASCGQSATFDGAGVVISGADLTASSVGGGDDAGGKLLLTAGSSGSAGSASGSKSKKKKKKPNPLNVLQKPGLLAPSEDPLQFLRPEFYPECFLPTKYASKGVDSDLGKFEDNGLTGELGRLAQSAQKQCDPYIANELFSKLLYFPKAIRYAFLMHMVKNPFPDHPYVLLNLWSGVPMPKQKDDRGNFISMVLDLVTALADLNFTWKEALETLPTATVESDDSLKGSDKRSGDVEEVVESSGTTGSTGSSDRERASTSSKKSTKKQKKNSSEVIVPEPEPDADSLQSKSLKVTLHSSNTSTSIVHVPRLLVTTLRVYKDLIPDKIRLENGLSWGSRSLSEAQQKWVQGWWNVGHSFITSCRTVKMLAEACSFDVRAAGGVAVDPSAPLSSASNAGSPAHQSAAAFKCLLEQLRLFSNSKRATKFSADNENETTMLNSEVLGSCARYGSHVMLKKTSSRTMPPTPVTTTDDDCDDGKSHSDEETDPDQADENGKGTPIVTSTFQVTTKVLPMCSSLAYSMDCELGEIFEDLAWAEVNDSAKLHSVQLFADFLYRNWATSPAVLQFFQNNELQALPLVLQFALVQQLSFASSRGHQECLIHSIRHAFIHSGLLDLEKDPFSDRVVEISRAGTSSGHLHAGMKSHAGPKVPAAPTIHDLDSTHEKVAANNIFGESSLLSMLGDDSFLDFGDDSGGAGAATNVFLQECKLSKSEQCRLAALTYECIVMVKTRYLELLAFNRWKFGHPDAVQSASLNSLKEEIENSISAVRPLIDDIRSGKVECFEPGADEVEQEGGEFDLYDNLDYTFSGAGDERGGDSKSDVFVTACRDLHDELGALSAGGRRSDDGVVVRVDGGGSDVEVTISPPEPAGKHRHRLVKRLNTRTIIWLSKYSHSDDATSRMLDRMWSSALK